MGNMALELLHEKRRALRAPAFVTNRIFDGDFVEDCAVVECDGDGVSNRALVRVVIVCTEDLVLDTSYFGPEVVDALICSSFVTAKVYKIRYE